MEEWHPQFGEFLIPVKVDSVGQLRLNTGYGQAILQLDSKSTEIHGFLPNTNPTVYVHLNKVPEPPAPDYELEAISVDNGEVSLRGHLHRPKYRPSRTALIIVGGRGCYAGNTKYDLYARTLHPYGVSVLAYHKRGTGQSTGDCSTATLEDLADDLVAIKAYLRGRDDAYEHIGVLGASAGGWVIAKAAEKTDFDFMVSVVGPSTSVADQQLQSMDYGLEEFKLSATARAEITEYTNLMLEAEATPANFQRFEELLRRGDQNGWKELLEGTDIPASAAAIDSLWVRRHAYDPGPSLGRFERPFLAIYGEKDWIVPHRENVARLQRLFAGDRQRWLTTVVARGAGHSTETEEGYRELPNKGSYWRFFRISPQFKVALIRFLRDNDLID